MKIKTREQFTSPYYGVRRDYRKKTGKTWYKAELMVQGCVIRLGAFLDEKEAAYAFNCGFEFFKNGTHIIQNIVEIPEDRKKHISEYIRDVVLNHNWVHFDEFNKIYVSKTTNQ